MRKVIFFFSVLLCVRGYAVMIAGTDGTAHTTAPVADQGWSYVGQISSKPSSVTYIDNNWFITAYHIKQLDTPTGVSLGGNSYSINSLSWTRMLNPDSSGADLVMFRVNETVTGLDAQTLVASSVSLGTPLTMIGNGLNRGEEYDDGIGNHNTIDGYYYGSGASKRWGSNTVDAVTSEFDDVGYGSTYGFRTDFDNIEGEGHAVTYDSGGGVYVQNGETYDLAGIMIAAESGSDANGTYAAFKSDTIIADISVYSDQISTTAAIPEPTAISLIGLAGAVILFIRRLRA